jgi:hypothetical protein
MGPFSCQVEINISQGRHKTIRGNAFPVVSVRENESDPVMDGKALAGNKASKKTTRMTFFHGKWIFPINEHFCPDCLGVKAAYYDPFFFASMWVYAENTVRIRMLNPDQPFNVFRQNSLQQSLV